MTTLKRFLLAVVLIVAAHTALRAQGPALTAQDYYTYGRYFLSENLQDAEAIGNADLRAFAVALFEDDCAKAADLKSPDLALILRGVCSGLTFPKEFEQIQDPDWKRFTGLIYFWEPEFMEGYKSPHMAHLAKALYYRDAKLLEPILK